MDKKITIKYFLNEDISPAVYYGESNKRLLLYPVYVRITHNRKSTRFKFLPSVHIEAGSDVEEYFKEKHIFHLIEKSNDLINRVVDFEVGMSDNIFSLNGFGARYYFYQESLFKNLIKNDEDFIDLNLLIKKSSLPNLSKKSDNPLIQISLLLGMLGKEKLVENFSRVLLKCMILNLSVFYRPSNFLNLHDWLFTNHRKKFQLYLSSIDKDKLDGVYAISHDFIEMVGMEMPELRHELNFNKEELNQIQRASNILNEVFLGVPKDNIEDFGDYMDELIHTQQVEFYKEKSHSPKLPRIQL
jgi:hypothetical protein